MPLLMLQHFIRLTCFHASATVNNKKPNVRSASTVITPLGKRQKQPSIEQYLPSHDLVGVWLPAASAKRENSNSGTKKVSQPSIYETLVTAECERHPPSPPKEHPASQHTQDCFSLTLSLGSNTEDECVIDHELEQQCVHEVHQPETALQQQPSLPTLFPISSQPSSFSALLPDSTTPPMGVSAAFESDARSCSHQSWPPHKNQHDASHPQYAAAALLSPVASGHIVLGIFRSYQCFIAVALFSTFFLNSSHSAFQTRRKRVRSRNS
jgi:hypothetical protein